jgi:fatty-acyl-CoA synthase
MTGELRESYWPIDRSQPLLETTPTEMLRAAAGDVTDRIALIDADPDAPQPRTWTYMELLDTAERVAQALLRRFVPGERVAIWAPNRPEWVLLQHGLSMAGLIMVTVNPAYRDQELAYVLRQSRSSGVFYTDEYRGYDMAEAVAAIRGHVPDVREAVSFGDWDAFVAAADSGPRTVCPEITPDTPAQIQYTSGTTGFPKGALLHHRGVVNASAFVAHRAAFQEGGVWLNAMPMFHIGGVGQTEIGTLSKRGTYVLLPRFDAGEALAAIEAYRASVFLAVPTMLLRMLEHPDLASRDLSSLETLYSGATAVPTVLVERVKATFQCRFGITFGQTELHGTISQTHLHDPPALQAETVGQPMPQIEVKIADPGSGEVLPLGRSGEICARGYQTMIEYFDMPEATAAAIRADGWLHTGDLGTMDENGYLRISGRLKDVIIRGGENISPREIEELLARHPRIAEAVVGAPDERWGETVIAVIRVADTQAAPTPEDLHSYCRESLAKYKTPVGWCFVDALPSTATGKVQKFVLRDLIARGELVPQTRHPAPARSRRG